jgi:hypothetical protein
MILVSPKNNHRKCVLGEKLLGINTTYHNIQCFFKASAQKFQEIYPKG